MGTLTSQELADLAIDALTVESREDVLQLQAKFFDVAPGGPVTFDQLDAFMAAVRRISDARSMLLDGQTLIENVSRNGGGGPELTAVLNEAAARASRALEGETFQDVQEGEDAALEGKSWRRLIPGLMRKTAKAAEPHAINLATGERQHYLIDSKDHGPDRRWTMFVGHNGQDREKEWLTAEGFDLNCKAINATGHFPEAWIAHEPGTRWGIADFVDFVDGIYVVSGLVDDNPIAHEVADQLANKAAELGVSHSYAIVEQVGAEVRRFFDYEVSVLPRDRAALPETGIIIGAKESTMINDETKARISSILGEELAGKVFDGVDALNGIVDGAGIARKDADPLAKPEAVVTAEAAVVEAVALLETANKAAGIEPVAAPPAAHNTPTGTPPPAPPKPDEPKADSVVLDTKAITDLIQTEIKSVLEPIAMVIGEMGAGMAKLLQSDDSKLADRIRNAGPAHIASKDGGAAPVVTPDMSKGPGISAEDAKDAEGMAPWFLEQIGFGPEKKTEPVTS